MRGARTNRRRRLMKNYVVTEIECGGLPAWKAERVGLSSRKVLGRFAIRGLATSACVADWMAREHVDPSWLRWYMEADARARQARFKVQGIVDEALAGQLEELRKKLKATEEQLRLADSCKAMVATMLLADLDKAKHKILVLEQVAKARDEDVAALLAEVDALKALTKTRGKGSVRMKPKPEVK